jgi:hypothetical protein
MKYVIFWESQMTQSGVVTGPARLGPVSGCTAIYRLVLSSERAPYMKKKISNCQT